MTGPVSQGSEAGTLTLPAGGGPLQGRRRVKAPLRCASGAVCVMRYLTTRGQPETASFFTAVINLQRPIYLESTGA